MDHILHLMHPVSHNIHFNIIPSPASHKMSLTSNSPTKIMYYVTRATHPSRLTALDMIKVSGTSTAAQLINKFRVFLWNPTEYDYVHNSPLWGPVTC